MYRLILIILFSLFVSLSHSDEIYKPATNCNDLAHETLTTWSTDGELNDETFIFNRTKRKDISFDRVSLKGIHSFYFQGINIKTKDGSFPICFDAMTVPTIILIENRELYNGIDQKMEKHLYVSFHSMINCGVPCTESSVHSISFYKNKSHFWGLTIRDVEYPSIWFMNHLTFKEAYAYAKGNSNHFYWRGKWYKVN